MLTFQAQNLWQGRQAGEFSAAAFVSGVKSKIETVREGAVEFYDDVVMAYALQTGFGEQSAPAPRQEGAQ